MSEIDEQAAEPEKPAFAVSARQFAQPSFEYSNSQDYRHRYLGRVGSFSDGALG